MCPNNPQQDSADDFFDRFKSGDAAAFKVIYDRYGWQLKIIMSAFVGDRQAAEDVVAHAFTTLFDNLARINEEKHIYGYLYRVAYNKAIEHGRCKKRREATGEELKHLTEQEYTDPKETEAAWTGLMDNVNSLIEQMPPAMKRIFRLYYFSQLDVKTIAALSDLSKQTVINQLNKGLGFLRTRLGKPGIAW